MLWTQNATRQSEGTCYLCNATLGKRAFTKHLAQCVTRNASAKNVPQNTGTAAKTEKIFHILIKGADLPEYWMHIEIPASATLQKLDRFLRDTWLECCGHLSAFRIEKGREVSKKSVLNKVLQPGTTFIHEYDFGTPTVLVLKVVGGREGSVKKNTVRILARNIPPAISCQICKKAPATAVCGQCIYEDTGWVCDACTTKHPCGEEEMLLPAVNSPRVGVCGYEG